MISRTDEKLECGRDEVELQSRLAWLYIVIGRDHAVENVSIPRLFRCQRLKAATFDFLSQSHLRRAKQLSFGVVAHEIEEHVSGFVFRVEVSDG